MSEMDNKLRERLERLREVPPRNPQRAAQARVNYLAQAEQMAQAVSHNLKMRPIHRTLWSPIVLWKGKERSLMLNPLLVILMMVVLAVGGGGATVAAAQGSLPDQPLYAVKMWSEQARLSLATHPQAAWQLALSLSERRIEEMGKLAQAGSPVDEALELRYQAQLEHAFRQIENLPDDQALRALEQVHQRLQSQQQRLGEMPPETAQLVRVRAMIQERLRVVEDALRHPQQLRQWLRQNRPEDVPQPGKPGTGGNPWMEETPTPGSGYGSGNGGNPWTEDTPTPGSGYGQAGGGKKP